MVQAGTGPDGDLEAVSSTSRIWICSRKCNLPNSMLFDELDKSRMFRQNRTQRLFQNKNATSGEQEVQDEHNTAYHKVAVVDRSYSWVAERLQKRPP
jgi:hypothetical protein